VPRCQRELGWIIELASSTALLLTLVDELEMPEVDGLAKSGEAKGVSE